MISNNVTRLLDAHKIEYTLLELPKVKLGAVETAEYLKVPLELIYKTIVLLKPNGKPVLCIVPGNTTVDLKAVANYLGEKKIRISSQDEAECLTHLQTGGISPFALINKGFYMILDASIMKHAQIYISAGQRGLNIRISVENLIELLHPDIAPVSKLLPSA